MRYKKTNEKKYQKKHHKKMFLIAAFCLIFSCVLLAGCGSDGKELGAGEGFLGYGKKLDTGEQETELIRVGFSQVGAESSWRVANSESMKNALSEEKGFELIFDDAKQKQENQYKAIRTFIQQQVDFIVLAPITETGWDDVLQEAKQAGIPVIIMDRQIAVEDESLYSSWVGSDFYKESEIAMGWLEEELAARGKDQEEIGILHIMGTEGATAQIYRTMGLYDKLESQENWNVVEVLKGEYTEAKAYELTSEYLRKNRNAAKNIDVIYSENDNMTFGVIRALEEAGISYGGEDGIIIISFDAVKSALEQCLAGKINLCVECNPLHGPRVGNLIHQLIGRHEPQKNSFVGETYFTYDTITQARIDDRAY